MGQLKYSFIIPVYNCENYLKECVESIQAQVLDNNYEIILIDDGSTDESFLLCDNYAKQWENIHTFHKENGGASSARNYGIEKAKGEYLLFIDGDDTIDYQLISCIEKVDMKDDVLMIYGMSFDYYEGNHIEHSEVLSYPESGYFSVKRLKEDFETFFRNNSLSSACNKVFSKKILYEYDIRFDESMNLYEDFEFVLRYLCHVKYLYCINEGFYHYRLVHQDLHLKNRVYDLNQLTNNLKKVGNSLDSLGMGENSYVQLYTQLLYLHMLYTKQLRESILLLMHIVQEDENLLKKTNSIQQLDGNEFKLLQFLKEEKTKELYRWMRIKRLQRNVKNLLRPFVKRIRKMIAN